MEAKQYQVKNFLENLTMMYNSHHKVYFWTTMLLIEVQAMKDFLSYAGEKSKDAFGVVKD